MRVYFIRHGETESNITRMNQSSNDPLSEVGINQAKVVAKRCKELPVEVILTSPFERAKLTAEIIQQQIKVPLEVVDQLKEIKRASEFDGKHLDHPEIVAIRQLILQNASNPDYRYSDEETFNEFKQRVEQIFQILEGRPEESVLVVTHSQVLVMLFAQLMFGDKVSSLELNKVRTTLRLNNSGITVFDYINNKWSVITWNDIVHLEN